MKLDTTAQTGKPYKEKTNKVLKTLEEHKAHLAGKWYLKTYQILNNISSFLIHGEYSDFLVFIL